MRLMVRWGFFDYKPKLIEVGVRSGKMLDVNSD